ncbi:MAG TPA: DUF4234 domain-containing protein [Candidatus Saccharimonadales bacterium]|nr:DUF4234 domain-containing protein [Candidatus Saccharimonadales bacterium]
MKKRSPWAVLLLPFITLGIYSWYWEVKTKGEMNALGQKVPTAWLWLIPFVGYLWWAWKYSEGVGNVTKEKAPAILVFLLMIFTGSIGDAIIQSYYNKLPDGAAATSSAAPAVAAQTPEAPATTPESSTTAATETTAETPAPAEPAPEAPTSDETTPPAAPMVQ